MDFSKVLVMITDRDLDNTKSRRSHHSLLDTYSQQGRIFLLLVSTVHQNQSKYDPRFLVVRFYFDRMSSHFSRTSLLLRFILIEIQDAYQDDFQVSTVLVMYTERWRQDLQSTDMARVYP